MLSLLPTLETVVPALLRECATLSGDFESTTPILLTRQRSQRREWLTERCSTVDAELSRLLKMQDELATATRLLAAYRTRLAHARSPVSALPNELLESILQLVCSPENDDDDLAPLMPWHLSHVCSRWRSLVLSIPTIWAVIPIKASTKDEFMLEYTARARELPLVLYLDELQENGLWDYIPPGVMRRTTTVQFTRHLPNWWAELRMHSWPRLKIVHLGPTIPGTRDVAFRLDYRKADSIIRRARTLIFRGAFVGSYEDADDSNERLEYEFGTLKLEGVAPRGAMSTLGAVWSPWLTSFWLSDVRVQKDMKPLEAESATTAGLRDLHVIGTDISVATAGVILAQCRVSTRLESLDIEISADTENDPEGPYNHLIDVFAFAQHATTIRITSSVSSLIALVWAMSEARPSSLASLSIKLLPTAFATEVVGEAFLRIDRTNTLTAMKELDHYFSVRAGLGQPRLGHLQVDRALLVSPDHDEAYFRKHVDRLEVIG